MKDTKYKAREYKSEAIIKKASDDIQVIAESLLPEGYRICVEECDKQSGNKFTPQYKYLAKITTDRNGPHFIAYSRTQNGVYARVAEILFSKPVYPIA